MKFIADDGTEFATRAECLGYENEGFLKCLAGLTTQDLRAGLRRENLVIADALETAGRLIGERRRGQGEFKPYGPRKRGQAMEKS